MPVGLSRFHRIGDIESCPCNKSFRPESLVAGQHPEYYQRNNQGSREAGSIHKGTELRLSLDRQ